MINLLESRLENNDILIFDLNLANKTIFLGLPSMIDNKFCSYIKEINANQLTGLLTYHHC